MQDQIDRKQNIRSRRPLALGLPVGKETPSKLVQTPEKLQARSQPTNGPTSHPAFLYKKSRM